MRLTVDERCICCDRCSEACNAGAIYFDGEKYAVNQSLCVGCGYCIDECNTSAISDIDNPALPIHPHEDRSLHCDLLVIGGGAAGMLAAVRVASTTGKRVIVVEKDKKPGGSGYFAGGVRLFGTQMEKNHGLPDQTDDYIRAAMNTTRWMLDPQLISNAFRAIPKFFDWMCQWSDIKDYYEIAKAPNSTKVVPIMKREYFDKGGKIYAEIMSKRCAELDIPVLCEHAARELFVDDAGKAIGAIATDPGGVSRISFKACLLSTGSLIHSKMLERCIPFFSQAQLRKSGHTIDTLTGDALDMAEKIGIPINYDSICFGPTGPSTYNLSMKAVIQSKRSEALKVNLNGERWCNEVFAVGRDAIWPLSRQPECVSFTVMDSEILTAPVLPMVKILSDSSFGRNITAGVPDPDEDISEPTPIALEHSYKSNDPYNESSIEEMKRFSKFKGGHVIWADTIDELADKMGVPPAKLSNSVERYNELCAKGLDEDFFKYSERMRPIEKAPFFAFKNTLFCDGVFGGLDTDSHMRVIGKDGPVYGLYAAGDIVSGRFVNQGGEKKQTINDYTWAVASGFLAADSIADQLLSE